LNVLQNFTAVSSVALYVAIDVNLSYVYYVPYKQLTLICLAAYWYGLPKNRNDSFECKLYLHRTCINVNSRHCDWLVLVSM